MSTFPDGFLWGAATSSHQIEGNNVNNDWWRMENATPSMMTEPSGDACDSWHRYEEDLDLLAASGLNTYRFSLEWSRIEPAPGEFSAAALRHYQSMVDACHRREIKPVVTIHHFTHPAWFRSHGSWLEQRGVDAFKRYADKALGSLRDLEMVCTLNEPNLVSTWAGVMSGASSPEGGEAKPRPEITARLLDAHTHTVEVARSHGLRAGLVLAMTAYEVAGGAAAQSYVDEHRALDEDVFIEAARADDFLGVQVYTRRVATDDGLQPFGHDADGPSARTTLTGWTFAPRSLGYCVRRAHELAPDLPLYVTENGIATADDEERIEYTTEALFSLREAMDDGAPVRGYLHWSLLDNFEWIHGYRPTFGLIAVDRETFARTPKPSLDWLGRLAKQNGATL